MRHPLLQSTASMMMPATLPAWRSSIRSRIRGRFHGATTTDEAIVRIDHHISAKDTLFGHYAHNSIFRPAAEFIPTFFTTSTLASHNAAINYTHILTPRTLNNFQVSFNRSYVTQVDPRTNTSFNIQQALGIAGIPGAGRTNGFPNIAIQNFTTIGDPTNTPLIQPDQVLQLTDNLTIDRGRHHMKAGIDFWHWLAGGFRPRGSLAPQHLPFCAPELPAELPRRLRLSDDRHQLHAPRALGHAAAIADHDER
jgi:hypothetical protein